MEYLHSNSPTSLFLSYFLGFSLGGWRQSCQPVTFKKSIIELKKTIFWGEKKYFCTQSAHHEREVCVNCITFTLQYLKKKKKKNEFLKKHIFAGKNVLVGSSVQSLGWGKLPQYNFLAKTSHLQWRLPTQLCITWRKKNHSISQSTDHVCVIVQCEAG